MQARDLDLSSGRRTKAWIKSVVRYRSPMVVGGWAPGRAGSIGSLLVGGYNEAGALLYCGQVGFGLSAKMRETLAAKFIESRCERSPFGDLQAVDSVRWLTPSVVVNVDYREFTGRLRHPSLKGFVEVEPRSVSLPESLPIQVT